ncbi:hypothetical protein APTSU1_001692500 [Apodemus speciosus]|uniref:Uncharacterized protein n=1 Tax=Apodemus speciosus TaxID=105296 RepID=A0ABQ0FR06_APOSI
MSNLGTDSTLTDSHQTTAKGLENRSSSGIEEHIAEGESGNLKMLSLENLEARDVVGNPAKMLSHKAQLPVRSRRLEMQTRTALLCRQ